MGCLRPAAGWARRAEAADVEREQRCLNAVNVDNLQAGVRTFHQRGGMSELGVGSASVKPPAVRGAHHFL